VVQAGVLRGVNAVFDAGVRVMSGVEVGECPKRVSVTKAV
jgi:hypothetical protein